METVFFVSCLICPLIYFVIETQTYLSHKLEHYILFIYFTFTERLQADSWPGTVTWRLH